MGRFPTSLSVRAWDIKAGPARQGHRIVSSTATETTARQPQVSPPLRSRSSWRRKGGQRAAEPEPHADRCPH
ncbi:hypothetical protein AGOR_G00175700 [Albula goreensis]|uniref:Uncharacterized protein n=1 Tax=Albula goreensis TaxID=1534307 RepID=A0A8T3CZH2_9TELE|nr:hypothetical protein AGOR_G00175700 [Albula goreensis]